MASAGRASVGGMQERLFEQETTVDFDEDFDPYAEWREQAVLVADDYGISLEKAMDVIVANGSERAARRVLDRRWLLGEGAEAA